MSDIRGKARSDRSWVERLLRHVPGFRGYLGKEERRQTDKLLREQLVDRLDQFRGRLDLIMGELTDGGRLHLVDDVDRLKKAIGCVGDKIRHASYGYSGLFDAVKVHEAELDRLYEFDAALVDRLEVLEDTINLLRSGPMHSESVEPLVARAMSVTRELEEHLDRRSQLITEYRAEA